MFLIIENGSDPSSPSSAELDFPSGPDLAYIPVLFVPLDTGIGDIKLRLSLERLRADWGQKNRGLFPRGRADRLVRSYVRAVRRTGSVPFYLSSPRNAGAEKQPDRPRFSVKA